ncbi:tetratricopeptide repeat protein [Nostoc sp. C110]|uniref:tetratricopeptide repeat protein n=1 Tax=Nostoc sp. C110 TaxID=3349876 RepID=UPI00370D8CFD
MRLPWEEIQTYYQFLMEVLRATADSSGNAQVVYPLLANNTDKLDGVLAEILRRWGRNTLGEAKADKAKYLAAVIFTFSNLIAQFPLGSKASNMEIAITGYEVVLTVTTREALPQDWAATQNNLAIAYRERIKGDRADNIEKAIAAYTAALTVRTREALPIDWAMTQNDLAIAYSDRIKGDRAENIEKAIAALTAALTVYTQSALPQDWAATQNNLGLAYSNRIEAGRAENIENAIAALTAALTVYTQSALPQEWAMTQHNLAIAYSNRIKGDKAENLDLAITAYQQALTVNTRTAFPQDWARTQLNLGLAYLYRIKGERAENLENAIAACTAALQISTHAAFPQDWARTQMNLGTAYSERILGERSENLELAIACYQEALKIYTFEAFPVEWARTQANLANAYSNRNRGDQADNLEQGIAAYQQALKVFTFNAFPVDWARIQNNLAVAYSNRIGGERADNLEQAIAASQQALRVYSREAFPYEWASTCHNLANAYSEKIHSDSLNNINRLENLEISISFYQKALIIYTPERFPNECLIIREKLNNVNSLFDYYQTKIFSLSQAIKRGDMINRIEFVRADILSLEVDAIVIPINTNLDFGAVGRQLHERLGSSLSVKLLSQPRPSIGEILVIDANPLPASHLFFTPINYARFARPSTILQGINAALNKAINLSDVRTIAFPSLGTGALGFNPSDLALEILKIVIKHLENENKLEKVIFTLVDEAAYQAYISAYQMLLLETSLLYEVLIAISPKVLILGEEIEISVNVKQAGINKDNTHILQIPLSEAVGSEFNIILTAPSFQFNGDNTTSLPIDPDTANVTQTATFNLTALRSGRTKIKAELYCGETYKTTLETEVEVTAFEEAELRPLIAARSRPVPQPDIILQLRTTWNADISACTFNYHIDSYQPRLLFADDVDYNSQSFSTTWVERSHSLLKTTLEEAATSLREDFRSRLVSLGQYLFQSLLPEELQNTFRTIAGFNRPFTLLILADQDAWFPWELLHDGQKFLGDRFIIGRWLWELEKSRPYEFPVGAVNVAYYASVEQPELWTELLHSSGAPPPISMQAGIFNDITFFESIRGLHLIRYGQSVDTTNRQNAPVRVNSSSDIQDIEREVQPAKLSLHRNHPLVSLSYLNAGQAELTALEQTWASTFVRAGCSAFVGSLWAAQPNVEAAFVSAFYNSIWAGQTLGVAFQTARRLAKTVVPESLDWLAYVLFGDPMARPYRPVQGQGYAVVEPIGQEIDDPVSPGSTVRFRVSLRRTPPVWYENRLMEVAEDLSFDDLRVFIVTSGLQVTPGDSILMTRTATGDYLGWFTLTAPAEMETRSVLVQVYLEDGIEAVHNLRFALNIVKQDGEAQ